MYNCEFPLTPYCQFITNGDSTTNTNYWNREKKLLYYDGKMVTEEEENLTRLKQGWVWGNTEKEDPHPPVSAASAARPTGEGLLVWAVVTQEAHLWDFFRPNQLTGTDVTLLLTQTKRESGLFKQNAVELICNQCGDPNHRVLVVVADSYGRPCQ